MTISASLRDARWPGVWGLSTILALAITGCLPDNTTTVNAPQVTYAAVSTGDFHACGLTTEGEIYCWSVNLGQPTLVSGSLQFEAFSTFSDHTCGVGTDGSAYCWGVNMFGQLGTAAGLEQCVIFGALIPCSRAPVRVESDLTFRSVLVGGGHTCALDENGAAHCWGIHVRGQLGTAEAVECQLGSGLEPVACSVDPVLVQGNLVFQSISAGRAHTCGVTTSGDAYCWGAGGSGRLGNGALDNSHVPSLVSGGLAFNSVSAGGTHTCGVTTSNDLYCWGSNADLQLGSKVEERGCGTQLTRCVTTPHRVLSDATFSSVTASDAPAFGGFGPPVGGHTCALTTDRVVYCWGLNEQGQLGDFSEFRSASPVRLDGAPTLTQVSAGLANTCGLTTEGGVFCWAYGSPLDRWRVRTD